jgi:ATP-dependent DNA ligase
MLATLATELPRGDAWTYEVKWDGYRALGYVRAVRPARFTERQRPDGALSRCCEGAGQGGAISQLRRRR